MSYPVAQGKLVNLAVTEVDYTKEGALYPEPWSVASVDCKPLIKTLANWEPDARALGNVSASILNFIFSVPLFEPN